MKYGFQVVQNKKFSEDDYFKILMKDEGSILSPVNGGPGEIRGKEGKVKETDVQEEKIIRLNWVPNCDSDYKLSADKKTIVCETEEKANLFGSFITLAHAENIESPNINLEENIRHIKTIMSERSSIKRKLWAFSNLIDVDSNEIQKIGAVTVKRDLTFLLDLVDLSRHNNDTLASFAKKLSKKINIEKTLKNALLDSVKPPMNIIKRMTVLDSETKNNIFSALKKNKWEMKKFEKRALEKIKTSPTRQLIPTGTNQGDRYYVQANWAKDDNKTLDCLTFLFNTELLSNRTLEEEKKKMKNGWRLVYWYSRTWAIYIAEHIERCGGRAKFISGS